MGTQPPRMSYLVLFCQDLPASVRFYHDRLGLARVTDSPSFVQLDAGGARIGLHAADAARRTTGCNLHFDVPDVRRARADYAARGIAFGDVVRESWGASVARAVDPDGNTVELVQWE